MKPLMEENVIGVNKVTTVDISDDGGFLISGYKKGQVALWDLVNYKLIRYIEDIHLSDVVNAKIYHMDESENLYAVSAEDSGRV
jgi:WD40 repeat protein